MANLNGTENHVFTKDDVIGKGATCEVYKGIHKITGETHALKIFEHRMGHASTREIQALNRLQHPNIVKFLGEETELQSKRLVAVMEFCDKSLYNVLCEPENVYGLPEEEFYIFFRHIVEGMKHLRQHGFLHRDIKPGNILVAFEEDGSSVYKLSDFGTAKPVMETEAFQSLVGTEEYLHPDIFKAAFIDNYTPRTFDVSADLWSLGATIYHAATGNVPFRPYGGRDNRGMMFNMIAQKEYGVISGEQKTPSGNVVWSRELPATCTYSKWLKESLTTILAKLMEKELRLAHTFETFFVAADDILDRRVLHVFSTTSAKSFQIYLKKDNKYSDVQESICLETNVPADGQILCFDEGYLKTIVGETEPVQNYPITTMSSPLVMIRNTGLTDCLHHEEVCFWYNSRFLPDIGHTFPMTIHLDNDLRVARVLCQNIASIQKKIDLGCITQELFYKTIFRAAQWKDILVENLSLETRLYKERVKDISVMCCPVMNNMVSMPTMEIGKQSLEMENKTMDSELIAVHSTMKECVTIMEKIKSSSEATNKVFPKTKEWLDNKCQMKIQRLLQQAKEKKIRFEERRRQRSFPYHEEQLHKFDRKEMIELHKKSLMLWKDQCKPDLEKSHENFLRWHREFTALQKDIEQLQEKINDLKAKLKAFVKKHAKSNFHSLKSSMGVTESSCYNTPKSRKSAKRKDLTQTLITQLDSLTSDMSDLKKDVSESNEQLKSLEQLTISDLPELENYVDS
ncbi:hypothetical protein CHS0354_002991 [Potamilus streckersoni]|uniref:IkappaB kinase n=1 Tax=Potamilus streckersoni TaxID=2493646 RepID=A0AAE0VIB6_9BIVA|nr:hypothetical protein CHS0354_002991 [Potamilus streckersoni]